MAMGHLHCHARPCTSKCQISIYNSPFFKTQVSDAQDAAIQAHIGRQLQEASEWSEVYNTVSRYRDYLDPSHVHYALKVLPAMLQSPVNPYERTTVEEMVTFLLEKRQLQQAAGADVKELERYEVNCHLYVDLPHHLRGLELQSKPFMLAASIIGLFP